jgi:hypothetical protein
MKVVFLDIDGVLDTIQGDCYHMLKGEHQSQTYKEDMFEHLDYRRDNRPFDLDQYRSKDWCPVAVSNLTWLLRSDPEIKIVVSSTWRSRYSNDNIRWLFVHYPEIFNRVIGRTKKLFEESGSSARRGIEIQEWLDRHRHVRQFCIIDDDADMEHLMKYLVQTDGHHGMQFTDIDKALEIMEIDRKGFTDTFFDAQRRLKQ